MNAKGHPDGFLSHFSSLRNFQLGRFFDSLLRPGHLSGPFAYYLWIWNQVGCMCAHELQGGTFTIAIEGDLFKASVELPLTEE